MNVACTQCGTPSPPGNRFCGRCGTPLPPSPGNLPQSTRTAPSGPPVGGASTPCWQCGTAVDPLHQPACPVCGANLVMPAPGPLTPAMAGPPLAAFGPPGPPPPFAVAAPSPAPRHRREPLVSGVLLTVIVAIVIVLLLAVVGIIAGQAIGR